MRLSLVGKGESSGLFCIGQVYHPLNLQLGFVVFVTNRFGFVNRPVTAIAFMNAAPLAVSARRRKDDPSDRLSSNPLYMSARIGSWFFRNQVIQFCSMVAAASTMYCWKSRLARKMVLKSSRRADGAVFETNPEHSVTSAYAPVNGIQLLIQQ